MGLEEVVNFKYLGVMTTTGKGMGEEGTHKGMEIEGTLGKFRKYQETSKNKKSVE